MTGAVADRFAWRHWPEGSVVFDRHLGHTHALSREAAAVLQAALAEPDAGIERLCALAGDAIDGASDAERHARVAAIVEQLRQQVLS